jgi:hypothetical protein
MMGTPIPNSFTSYKLTEDEQRAGHLLNNLNVAVFQNLRSQLAEEKLNLAFTPNDILSYTQQEAHLKGQLDILNYILAAHEESTLYNQTERN